MLTLTISLDSLSFYIAMADIIVLLSYVLYLFHKKRSLEKSIKDITEFITEYFTNAGAEVKVTCFKLEGDKRFVALIESQPLKRFRYSNVLENNLTSHILTITGNAVEKIFWRFPIQLNKHEILASQVTAQDDDNDAYFTGGIAPANESTEYNVSEASWEDFEKSKN